MAQLGFGTKGPTPVEPEVGGLRTGGGPTVLAADGPRGRRATGAPGDNSGMAVHVDESLDGIDWARAKADLAGDDFDNGRSPHALRASFERSQHVAIARDGERVVGMARVLSDGVCNAYLLDVWTMSAYRRRGIGTAMVRQLMSRVPGQHVGLQTDDAEAFYVSLGYRHQPVFMSAVVGEWLVNEANARLRAAAATKDSSQTGPRLTLYDLFQSPDFPERPSPDAVRLVCVDLLSWGPLLPVAIDLSTTGLWSRLWSKPNSTASDA